MKEKIRVLDSPKNRTKYLPMFDLPTGTKVFCSFFGRREKKYFCFWDLLTFKLLCPISISSIWGSEGLVKLELFIFVIKLSLSRSMIWIFSHRRDETAIKAVNKKPIYRVVLYQTIVSVYNIAECILYTVHRAATTNLSQTRSNILPKIFLTSCFL